MTRERDFLSNFRVTPLDYGMCDNPFDGTRGRAGLPRSASATISYQ